MWNSFCGKHKGSIKNRIVPLCSLPYSVPNTLFATTIYPDMKSLQNRAFKGNSSPKQPIWTLGRYLQKAFEFYPYTIILLKTNTPKICKCKIFTSLSAHVSEQEKKITTHWGFIWDSHKWGILIKQDEIWIALKEKTKLVCSKSRL